MTGSTGTIAPPLVLERFTGMGQFGPAYQVMLENDSHAPGSVDGVLTARMVRLVADTADHLYAAFTPTDVRYEAGSRPELECHAVSATAGGLSAEERISSIARFCAALGASAPQDLEQMLLGGTEEEIIARGSDWCTDVARVGCTLCQVAGMAARMVYLADTHNAYSGHAIIEARRSGVWGAVDPTTGVVYRSDRGAPVSTWQLMNDPELIDRHREATGAPCSTPAQFTRAAISNYPILEHVAFDYTVSPVSPYYRSILEMSDRGWPGGLRWLHGEGGTTT